MFATSDGFCASLMLVVPSSRSSSSNFTKPSCLYNHVRVVVTSRVSDEPSEVPHLELACPVCAGGATISC